MLKVGYLFCNCMPRKLFEHDSDIDQTIASTVNKHDWRFNISCRELRDSIIPVTRTKAQRRLDIVIKHLEALVSYNLEPMYHALGAREGVQVRVCSELLVDTDVFARPIKEK